MPFRNAGWYKQPRGLFHRFPADIGSCLVEAVYGRPV